MSPRVHTIPAADANVRTAFERDAGKNAARPAPVRTIRLACARRRCTGTHDERHCPWHSLRPSRHLASSSHVPDTTETILQKRRSILSNIWKVQQRGDTRTHASRYNILKTYTQRLMSLLFYKRVYRLSFRCASLEREQTRLAVDDVEQPACMRPCHMHVK